ncbi:hypothetical protein HK405_001252, partial [Cladochytrium tenue]
SSTITTMPTPLRILCVGDSLTLGYVDGAAADEFAAEADDAPASLHPFALRLRTRIRAALPAAIAALVPPHPEDSPLSLPEDDALIVVDARIGLCIADIHARLAAHLAARARDAAAAPTTAATAVGDDGPTASAAALPPRYDYDWILVMAGTNDLDAAANVPAQLARLRSLWTTALAACPPMPPHSSPDRRPYVLVMTLLDGNVPELTRPRRAFNAGLRDLVALISATPPSPASPTTASPSLPLPSYSRLFLFDAERALPYYLAESDSEDSDSDDAAAAAVAAKHKMHPHDHHVHEDP